MTCLHCNDTGSLIKDLLGDLDCAYCGVADERMRLEAWVQRVAPDANLIDAWIIYQHGKAASAARQNQ